jgi:sugar lactone lactonase YvrE
MKKLIAAGALALAASFGAVADDGNPFNTSVTTLITTPLVIEGLTNDSQNNLYTPGRALNAADPCPVYQVNIDHPTLTVVGFIPPPGGTASCSPSGLQFGPDGQLYVTQTDRIYRFKPNATTPPTATVFATGVPGTNGLAFDWNGNLWTGDGTTGVGRVWRISPDGATVTEMFRIQPMANEVNLVSGTGGVGRDIRSLPTGTITVTPTSRNAANTLGSQPLVANGLQFFGHRLYIADSARGAIWRVTLQSDSTPIAHVGCDVTFTANTLCLDHVVVQNPMLEGIDGFVFDVSGRIWADANERQAIIYVASDTIVLEIFRNPVDPGTKLRNNGPLETPTSPVLVGHKFCTANSDSNRRDNSPNTAGEIGGPQQPKGKISCLDQRISVPGLVLPGQ